MSSEQNICIADQIRAFGLLGQVKARAIHPDVLADTSILQFRWKKNDIEKVLDIRERRDLNNGFFAIGFKGFNNPEMIRKELQGGELYVSASEAPDIDIDFTEAPDQCLGYDVVAETGEHLGKVLEITEGAAHPYFIVGETVPAKIQIPAIDVFVLEVNDREKKMIINWEPLRGLYEN